MKILHRYLLRQLVMNFILATTTFVALFILFDFFDRIGNILKEDVPTSLIAEYFLLKIPQILTWVAPIGMLVSTLLTIGMLSKNSEFTAMRASGASVFWLTRPVILFALTLSTFALIFGETVVPHTQRRSREIYNIDIKQKDARGSYSQRDFWWRSGNTFYSVDLFDSRENSLYSLLSFTVDENFRIRESMQVAKVSWLGSEFGWLGEDVQQNFFAPDSKEMTASKHTQLPLSITKSPRDFFQVKTDARGLSYMDLRQFILEQEKSGLDSRTYLVELHSKVAFPFVILIVPLAVLPFAVRSARSGSLAGGFTVALGIGFSYYALHSLAVALGRAEFLPPLLAAWTANISLAAVGLALNLGAEAPDA